MNEFDKLTTSMPLMMMIRSSKSYVLLAFLGCYFWSCGGQTQASQNQTSQGTAAKEPLQATLGTFTDQILLTGELVAEEAVTLNAPNVNIWPMTLRLVAEDGTEVRAGQTVVELDNSQLVGQLDGLRTKVIEEANSLTSLEARLASEMAESAMQLVRSEADVDRAAIKVNIPKAILSEKEYNDNQLAHQKAVLELEKAQKQHAAKERSNNSEIRLQELALTKAEEELRRSEERIAALSLRAPKDGILIVNQSRRSGRQYQEGDTVFPGQDIARLPNLDTLLVDARLFDVDDGKIDRGMAVTATLDAFPSQAFKGKIREIDTIAQQLDTGSLRRSFRVRIDLEDLDAAKMRPGMSVKIIVDIPPRENVLLVPRESLNWTEDQPPIRGARARLADRSWRDVELGPCNSTHCVVESGLEEGTRLASAKL